MSSPENRDWAVFMFLGAILGVIVGAITVGAMVWSIGFKSGERQGQCDEACLPMRLVAFLEDGACRCEHDDIVRPKSKAAEAPLR